METFLKTEDGLINARFVVLVSDPDAGPLCDVTYVIGEEINQTKCRSTEAARVTGHGWDGQV